MKKHQTCVRQSIVLTGMIPLKLIVSGEHGRKWSVTLIKNGVANTLSFENRVLALKEKARIVSQYHQFGDARLYV